MAGKHAQTHIRHHHRHMAQHIKACQYHTTNLRGSDSHSPSHREKKKKKCTCLCISASAHSLHPHPFQSNPGSQGIIPRRRSKCHRITSTPPLPLSSPHVYSTDIFKKINPSRLNSALLLPTEPSMDHPAVCERVLAPQLAGSFRQAAC